MAVAVSIVCFFLGCLSGLFWLGGEADTAFQETTLAVATFGWWLIAAVTAAAAHIRTSLESQTYELQKFMYEQAQRSGPVSGPTERGFAPHG